VDWDELGERLVKMQEDCKASWDHLRAIVKHDNNIVVKIRYEFYPCIVVACLMIIFIHQKTRSEIEGNKINKSTYEAYTEPAGGMSQ